MATVVNGPASALADSEALPDEGAIVLPLADLIGAATRLGGDPARVFLCSDGWMTARTEVDGKFIVSEWKPLGPGGRQGRPGSWECKSRRAFSSDQAAQNKVDKFLAKHGKSDDVDAG